MSDSTLVGYVVGGIPVLIGGMGLLQGMEFLGLPAVVAGVGVVATAFGVAEMFGKTFRWVGRGGRAVTATTTNPQKKKRQHRYLSAIIGNLLFMSGVVYFYALDLQFVPREQWLTHLITTDPRVLVAYLLGGPIVTIVFVFGRLMLVEYCNERLIPGKI
jgi:hypothetical protein